jgi:2'-5' RNA ligase
MSPQLSRQDPTSVHTSNLFFALFPDAKTANELVALAERLRAQCGLKGRVLDPGQFHISLCHVGTYDGEIPEGILTQARRAALSIAAPPFEVAFDHARSIAGDQNKPFVLVSKERNSAIKSLQRTLGKALTKAGLGRWVAKAYNPHVTLLYDSQEISMDHIARISWTAHEFVLVRSLIGESHYDRLGAWPFQAPP